MRPGSTGAGDESRADAWKAWRAEAFADLFACCAAGPEFVWRLVDLLARRGQEITADSVDGQDGWGDYPTTTLRVLLNAAALDRLGHGNEAALVRAEWTSSYPTHAMAAFLPDLPVVADAILSSGSGLLPPDLAFSRTGQQPARALNRLRQNLPLGDDKTLQDPRAVVAAASTVYRQQPGADHRDRWQAARRHIVSARPAGLLAEEHKSATRLDDDQDRAAGRTHAISFFDAIDALE